MVAVAGQPRGWQSSAPSHHKGTGLSRTQLLACCLLLLIAAAAVRLWQLHSLHHTPAEPSGPRLPYHAASATTAETGMQRQHLLPGAAQVAAAIRSAGEQPADAEENPSENQEEGEDEEQKDNAEGAGDNHESAVARLNERLRLKFGPEDAAEEGLPARAYQEVVQAQATLGYMAHGLPESSAGASVYRTETSRGDKAAGAHEGSAPAADKTATSKKRKTKDKPIQLHPGEPADGLREWVDGLLQGGGAAPGVSSTLSSARLGDIRGAVGEQQQAQQEAQSAKVSNPLWERFRTARYEAVRRQCLGARRPWDPQTKLPDSLVVLMPGHRRLHESAEVTGASPRNSSGRSDNFRGVRAGRRLRFARVMVNMQALCKKKERDLPSYAQLTASQQALVECLKGDSGCLSADPATMEKEVGTMRSIQLIREGPRGCFLTTRSGECSRLAKNPESGDPKAYLQAAGADLPTRMKAQTDLKPQQFSSCALVSNGPLVKISENAAAIDAHESVWRFNLMAGGSAQRRWAGSKTTIRIFNRLRGMEAAGLRPGRGAKLKDTNGEQWLFWNAASSTYITDIRRKYSRVQPGLLHATVLTWIVKVYFQMRRDLAELGLTGFSCPDNLSSGVHSALMASQVCGRTNLFGFSYSLDVLQSRPGHMDKAHTMHKAHAWEFDVLLLRLLHVGGLLTVCTADDPSIDLKTLRRGSAAPTEHSGSRLSK